MNISKEAFEFVMNFYEEEAKKDYEALYRNANNNDCNNYTLEKAICQWASDKAYRDVCRTISFKETGESVEIQKSRMQKRIKVTNIIYDRIKQIDNYDTWHEATCNLIKDEYNDFISHEGTTTLYIGQVQKWLNMTLKWLWLYDATNPHDYFKAISEHKNDLHIPLDSFIIKYLKKEYNINISAPEWSRIKNYTEYFEYQKQLREKLTDISPIEWELIHWKKALNYKK